MLHILVLSALLVNVLAENGTVHNKTEIITLSDSKVVESNLTVASDDFLFGNTTENTGNLTDSNIEIIYPTKKLNDTEFKAPEVFKDFRPSQPLDVVYEYNRKPVRPAIGEAKTFGDYHFGLAAEIPQAPWLKVRHYFNNHEHEEQSNEASKSQEDDVKIRFPTPTPTPSNHPYLYINPMQPYPKLDASIPTATSSKHKKDQGVVILSKKPTKTPLTIDSSVRSTPKSISSEEYYEPSVLNHGLGVVSPPFYPQASGEAYIPPTIPYGHQTPNTFYSYPKPLHEKSKFDDSKSLSISPWKKIIKFLTAIIPFGLLISALTPTVIDVSPVPNQTATIPGFNTGRARLDHKENNDNKNYVDLLKVLGQEGCEERVLCELIVSAGSSSNSHQNINNLLDAFVGNDKDSAIKQKEELSRIFKAARNKKCKILTCPQIPEHKSIK